jgi:hypothetical protein
VQRVVQQAADLREVPAHHADLAFEPVVDGVRDTAREVALEPVRGCRQRLDLRPGTLERGVETLGPATCACLVDVFSRTSQRVVVHGRQGYAGCRMARG